MDRRRGLIGANLVLVFFLVLHDLDHVRQGRSLALPVVAVGMVGLIVTALCLGLALIGHRFARHAAIIVGFGSVVGFAAVHILPHWSSLSDPYRDVHVDTISWLGLVAPMLAAAMVGFIGLTDKGEA